MNILASDIRKSPARPDVFSRCRAGVLAGFPAIIVNTAILNIFDHLHVVTARGGLLTLLLRLVGPLTFLNARGWVFQQVFHIVVGIGMAVVYAIFLDGVSASAMRKGLMAAVVVWLANACIVLPSIGQGFAGSRVLTPMGMLTFAVAHTVFFLLAAILYERFSRSVRP